MAINAVFYENTVPQGTGVLAVQGDGGETDLFVPLRSTSVTGAFHGPVGSLVVTQAFRFSSEAMDRPIEAVYRFPLPGDAAVTGVVARFGDETVSTRLAERMAAEQEFDEAFRSGRRAALVTRESPDVFTLHLAGIPPDTDVVVETTVTVLARAVPKGWEIRLPVTIGPRYVRSDEDHPAVQANPLLSAADPGYRASLDLRLLPVAEVAASPAGASVERTADGTRVRLADAMPDRDFVIRWASAAGGQLTAWAADDGAGEFTYLLGLVTPKGEASAPRLPREVIIVADQSGSMSGSKWEAASASIRSFLDGLGPDERFNLCLFSNKTAWFSDRGTVPATPQAVAAAKAFMEETRLFGGTELGVALEQALGQPGLAGAYSRHVLVITDGEVTDGARILRLVESDASPRRVSVIAIDRAPNSYLLLELARLGGGVAKFLTGFGENAAGVGAMLRDLLAAWQPPVLTDAVLAAERPGLEAADYRVVGGAVDIGDLRPETPVFVVARVPSAPGAPTLSVGPREGPAVAMATALPGGAALAAALKVVFGAGRVRALEYLENACFDSDEVRRRLDAIGYALPAGKETLYPENRGEADRARLERLVVDESLRFGVPSTHTAFIGVSATAGEAPRVTVAVPNAVPAGWELAEPVLAVCDLADDWTAFRGMKRSPVPSASGPLERFDLCPAPGDMTRYSISPIPAAVRVPESYDLDALAAEATASAESPDPKTRRWEIGSFDATGGMGLLFRPFRIRKGRYVLVVAFPGSALPAAVAISVRLDGEEIASWTADDDGGAGPGQVVVGFSVVAAGRLEVLVLDPRGEWHRRRLTVFVRRGWTTR